MEPVETSEVALLVKGLDHSFGSRQVLHDVAFTIRRGEFTALLGLNGAGKTTLFSLITRLYDHRVGAIEVFGFKLKSQPSAALSRIGVVFQQSTLDLDLTVAENLHYHAALHGLGRRIAAARIAREIGRTGLQERLHEKVRQLSGGMRRRVEIARALLHDPSLLLLDEPTVGLDIASRQFLLTHVRTLCREEGLAVLWATHLIDEVADDSKVVILHQGRIKAVGAVPEVLGQSGKPSMGEAFAAFTKGP
ncbi:MAG TPA: ABC transporter ATP-binding protein [Stellaceae bacterium]|nr:ABC transporter ATP-binding protein [Stellaceae bacterium]